LIAAASVMFPIAFSRGITLGRTLQPDDVAGVSISYPAGDFTAATGSVQGRVRLGSRGLFGAHVVAFALRTGALVGGFALNDEGEFVIAGLAPGTYAIRAEPSTTPRPTASSTSLASTPASGDVSTRCAGPCRRRRPVVRRRHPEVMRRRAFRLRRASRACRGAAPGRGGEAAQAARRFRARGRRWRRGRRGQPGRSRRQPADEQPPARRSASSRPRRLRPAAVGGAVIIGRRRGSPTGAADGGGCRCARSLSADAENAAPVEAMSALTEYVIEGGARGGSRATRGDGLPS
jgi:hypothetical protein